MTSRVQVGGQSVFAATSSSDKKAITPEDIAKCRGKNQSFSAMVLNNVKVFIRTGGNIVTDKDVQALVTNNSAKHLNDISNIFTRAQENAAAPGNRNPIDAKVIKNDLKMAADLAEIIHKTTEELKSDAKSNVKIDTKLAENAEKANLILNCRIALEKHDPMDLLRAAEYADRSEYENPQIKQDVEEFLKSASKSGFPDNAEGLKKAYESFILKNNKNQDFAKYLNNMDRYPRNENQFKDAYQKFIVENRNKGVRQEFAEFLKHQPKTPTNEFELKQAYKEFINDHLNELSKNKIKYIRQEANAIQNEKPIQVYSQFLKVGNKLALNIQNKETDQLNIIREKIDYPKHLEEMKNDFKKLLMETDIDKFSQGLKDLNNTEYGGMPLFRMYIAQRRETPTINFIISVVELKTCQVDDISSKVNHIQESFINKGVLNLVDTTQTELANRDVDQNKDRDQFKTALSEVIVFFKLNEAGDRVNSLTYEKCIELKENIPKIENPIKKSNLGNSPNKPDFENVSNVEVKSKEPSKGLDDIIPQPASKTIYDETTETLEEPTMPEATSKTVQASPKTATPPKIEKEGDTSLEGESPFAEEAKPKTDTKIGLAETAKTSAQNKIFGPKKPITRFNLADDIEPGEGFFEQPEPPNTPPKKQ